MSYNTTMKKHDNNRLEKLQERDDRLKYLQFMEFDYLIKLETRHNITVDRRQI